MNKIQVVETFLSRVIHECESVASLQKWLSENCYCIYGKNLYLKANDERIFVRYNGSDPLPNVQDYKIKVDLLIKELKEEKELAYADFEKYVNDYEIDLDSDYGDLFHLGLARAIDLIEKIEVLK